jgi:predicted nucleic acid-binding protein
MIVLDSGGISKLTDRSLDSLALLKQLSTLNDVMLVPTSVLVECLYGNSPKDAPTFRFLQKCVFQEVLLLGTAQRAAELRRKSGHGSAVDAIVVALAEPGGTVLTGDQGDIEKLATHANKVYVAAI